MSLLHHTTYRAEEGTEVLAELQAWHALFCKELRQLHLEMWCMHHHVMHPVMGCLRNDAL